jgi:hypothetical protein
MPKTTRKVHKTGSKKSIRGTIYQKQKDGSWLKVESKPRSPKRASASKHPAGTRYEKSMKGVVYLMETQESGRAKVVGRVTPYTVENRKKGRMKVAAEVSISPPVTSRKKPKLDQLSNVSTLNASKYISTSEPFNPDTHVRIVVNAKTEIWRKKSA